MDASWKECFSKSHQCKYWFNSLTGETTWVKPTSQVDSPSSSSSSYSSSSSSQQSGLTTDVSIESLDQPKKRKHEDVDDDFINKDDKILKGNSSIESAQTHVAIIVPYRDLHHEQKRKSQLDQFIPSISSFLLANTIGDSKSIPLFKVYVIEQSNDGRKFNRGKLLNIGFKIAQNDGCNVFIFHDVDLLPSASLRKYYFTIPVQQPIHIARVWDRYSVNDKYFGGITSFSQDLFERINGFPNNFWGWGGEDDELYKRTKQVQYYCTAKSDITSYYLTT